MPDDAVMATKTSVSLVDDIDGSEATETVVFGLDGVNYEIDLSDEHASSLRDSLSAYVEAGRRQGGRQRSVRKTAANKPADKIRDLDAVRAWARENGHQVSDRGRISNSILSAFDEAH